MSARRLAAAVATLATAAALGSASAPAETVQLEGLRVSFGASLSPHALPRHELAPVAVGLSGEISTEDGSAPPQLAQITVELSRHGRLDYKGLPLCHYHQIQPASTAEAIETCPDSVVGEGDFRAAVNLPEQSPFPSQGDIVAFNGILHGKHVIYAHVYGTTPLPQSSVIAFRIGKSSTGGYATKLVGTLPVVAAEWGHVSAISLDLHRRFRYRNRPRSFFSAGCPAPSGVGVATSPFARASFAFADGRVLTQTMVRSCRVG